MERRERDRTGKEDRETREVGRGRGRGTGRGVAGKEPPVAKKPVEHWMHEKVLLTHYFVQQTGGH